MAGTERREPGFSFPLTIRRWRTSYTAELAFMSAHAPHSLIEPTAAA